MHLIKVCVAVVLFQLSVFAASDVWTGNVAERFKSGLGKIENPYIISTAEEFALMAKRYSDSAYYRLDADIVLNTGDAKDWATSAPKNKWTVYGDTTKFARVHLDGNGHSISGLYINSDKDYQGLFGAWSGIATNIVIKNSYVKGRDFVGTLAGSFEYARLMSGCYNPFGNKAGGNIENIEADVIVEGRKFVGGLVGLAGATSAKFSSSWMINYSQKERISKYDFNVLNIDVSGRVKADSVVGGVFGSMFEAGKSMGLINRASVTGSLKVGGILGELACGSGLIQHNINFGTVKGSDAVAGLIGYFQISDRYNFNELENLANLGNVSGNSRVAGLLNSSRGRISNSYNAGSVVGEDKVSSLFLNDTCSRKCLDSLHLYDFSEEHIDSIHAYADSMGAYFFPDTGAKPINKGYPLSAYFYSDMLFDHGRGTFEDPFLIGSLHDLRRFERHAGVNLTRYTTEKSFFRQTADIVFPKEDNEWTPVTANNIVYDGDGHSVSGFAIHDAWLDLDALSSIDSSLLFGDYWSKNWRQSFPQANYCSGFFKYLEESTIDNLKLKDIDVEGDLAVGGLLGCTSSNTSDNVILSRVSVDGSVKGLVMVGGIGGNLCAKLYDVANFATVTGSKYVSGIMNEADPGLGMYRFVRNHGDVTGYAYVAGIASERQSRSWLMYAPEYYVYNRGNISAQEGPAGGLFAEATIRNEGHVLHGAYNASNVTAKRVYGAFYGDLYTDMDLKECLDSMLYDKNLMSDPRNVYLISFSSDTTIVSDVTVASVDSKTLKSAGAKELGVFYGVDENNENDGYPVFHFLNGDGSSESPYIIATAEDFWKLYDLIYRDPRSPNHYSNSNYKLVADINLKASAKRPWMPVSLGPWGTFDGGGHTVSGIYVDTTVKTYSNDAVYAGLFRENLGTIKNLGIADSYIFGDTAGAVVAVNAGIIENCWNKNAVVEATDVAGGIVGVMRSGHIHPVSTRWPESDEEQRAIANHDVFINKTYNGGVVRGNYSAGIVGYVLFDDFKDSYISRNVVKSRVANSYNVGEALNGIVGSIYGSKNFLYYHDMHFEIVNVYNADKRCHKISSDDAEFAVNAYYVVMGQEECKDIGISQSIDEMKTKDFAKKLGEAFKYDADGVNNGFPIFSDKRGLDPDAPISVEQRPFIYKALQVSVIGREIHLNNLADGVNTALFDLRGKRVWNGTGKSAVIPVQKAGVYIVRNKYQIKKVIIR